MKKTYAFNAKFAAALALAASAALSGCVLDREPMAMATSAGPMDDPETAHPIIVSEQRAAMDLYPAAGRVDARDFGNIKEFVAGYHSFGGGRMIVAAPAGAAYGQAMAEVRKDLASAGLHGVIAMGTYPSTAEGGPIKFIYRRLTAHVPTPCGRWPTDITSASSTEGWNNAPYPNFGCAYQNALAQEVADPRDLVSPRAMDPADASMRMRAVRNVEAGVDPTTTWTVKLTTIGSVGN